MFALNVEAIKLMHLIINTPRLALSTLVESNRLFDLPSPSAPSEARDPHRCITHWSTLASLKLCY